MSNTDPRVDIYINKAAPFAQPILRHIRRLVHKACPEVEEIIKSGYPSFDYKGAMISTFANKNYCTLYIEKSALIKGLEDSNPGDETTGQFGQITSISDLPEDDILLGYFREAKRLNDENIKAPQKHKEQTVKELETPACLLEALKEDPLASETWDHFSYSHRKEYINWINESKNESTRKKRLDTTLEWLAEGKTKHSK